MVSNRVNFVKSWIFDSFELDENNNFFIFDTKFNLPFSLLLTIFFLLLPDCFFASLFVNIFFTDSLQASTSR